MHDQGQGHQEKKEQEPKYCVNFEQYDPKEKSIIYILWSIHNKKLRIGSKVFFAPLEEKFKINKNNWALVREFLSGANVLVDQVIIVDKIDKTLQERFAILDE